MEYRQRRRLGRGKRALTADDTRFDGVRVIAVDEHVWRHTRRGGKYVTVIIDLTPVRDSRGPARLLDMIQGRSKQVFATWLADRPDGWRNAVDAVAMDGFTGFKTPPLRKSPRPPAVMDPFHVVRLAGDTGIGAGDEFSSRSRAATAASRTTRSQVASHPAHTGADLLTDRQIATLTALFADDAHVEVEATWGIYQRMIAAYRHDDRRQGREQMVKLIDSISGGVPKALVEITKLGRTLKKGTADVLAYFDWPGTSNGPTDAINGRLVHLCGSALGLFNLTNYVARSLLEAGGFRPRVHPRL